MMTCGKKKRKPEEIPQELKESGAISVSLKDNHPSDTKLHTSDEQRTPTKNKGIHNNFRQTGKNNKIPIISDTKTRLFVE